MPVNVQLTDGNFSLGPETGFFYSFSNSRKELLQVQADGTEVDSFFVTRALVRNPILELHYDGTFFWTLEALPSNLGITIKRWRLEPVPTVPFPNAIPSEFRWRDELTLINNTIIKWESKAFCVEHYHRTVSVAASSGSSTIKLSSVENIAVGTSLYLGPSTATGFEDIEETVVVAGINTSNNTVSITKLGGLSASFEAGDEVDFVKSIFIFNDNSPTGTENDAGRMIRFSWPGKLQSASNTGAQFAMVGAADFDETTISWVRADQILQTNLATGFNIDNSIESNLRESDKATLIEVYDLIADLGGNVYLKLQQKESNETLSTGELVTTNFSPLFNFQTQTTLPVINSLALRFSENIIGSFDSGDTINVTAELRDQFNLPVLGRTIQFSATVSDLGPAGTPGTFSPLSGVTNVSGSVTSTYTPSNDNEDLFIDIQAQVV
jgi:hypothetical protein